MMTLEDSDAIRSIVLDAAPEAILVTDSRLGFPGPRIVYANPAFETLTGYTPIELLGQTLRIFQGPNTEQKIFDKLQAGLKTSHCFQGRSINYRKDRTEFIAEWHIGPIRDKIGKVTNYVSVQRDVTDQVQKEADSKQRDADQKQRIADHEQREANQEQRIADHEQREANQKQRIADTEQRESDLKQRIANTEQRAADHEQREADQKQRNANHEQREAALEHRIAELTLLLENRKSIERAKGIVMQQKNLSEADAHKLLLKKARDSNKSVVEIARSILTAADALL